MELRVWVDGTQRVVCGVKLTTTCQEIVFALAHATQQAGRFTMIERWRNNERLLSPNEQPLVTLQRWGDHMNEVEFILRKTSTDVPINQLQPQQQQRPAQALTRSNHDNESTTQQAVNTNGIRESPSNPLPLPSTNQQLLNDQSFDNVYQHHQYNLNRRPQTVLGPLTSSNSTLGLGANYLQPTQQTLTRLPNSFRTSMSASTLPNVTNSMTASPSNTAPMMRPHYADDQIISTNSSSILRHPHNGYPIQSETQLQQKITNQSQADQSQVSKNYPFEDLYSTINKKRNNQPPAVPAKPRVVGPIAPVANLPTPHQQQLQTVNNAQINFYHPNQSPLNIYPSSLRPRHPPGYLDYMEAMANRNSLTQPILSNPSYAQQSHRAQGNIFQRSFDHQHMYNMQRNGSSPVNSSSASNRYRYPTNDQLDRANYDQRQDLEGASSMQNVNPIRPKLIESGLVINRGSAVNVKLPPSSQNLGSHPQLTNDRLENIQNNTDTCSSVSQMGHDMLKVIEEQKKVLINQKNELDRLDNDQEYWETRQNSEQTELINRIESEIRQLEELWKENQAQIKKLENQDFEKELQELKSEQVKMELEIEKQRGKLTRCEKDIVLCKNKIEQLEAELANQESDSEDTSSSSSGERGELYMNMVKTNISKDLVKSEDDSFKSAHLGMHTNGTLHNGDQLSKEAKSSEDEEYEDDSGGDVSDDLNLPVAENKHRSVKDVAYVDKRGLISGIRSLKLDKSRALNRQVETIRSSTENMTSASATSSLNSKDKTSINNNIIDKRCPETNGQYPEKTANNNNKYEFLMTL